MASTMLSNSSLYFFDQMKGRAIKRAKKMPDELPSDMKYMNINPRLANFINGINKNRKGLSNQAGKKQNTFTDDDKARGEEKHSLLPENSILISPKNSLENLGQKASHIHLDDDQFMSPFDDYKYVAPTLLQELGKLLFFFSQFDLIFPQGVVNVLNYTWKELIEGAVYTKKHCQAKKGPPDVSLPPEESENKPTGAATAPVEKADHVKNSKNKGNATLTDNGKDKGGHHVAQNKLPGHKSPQNVIPNLAVTISFSMASQARENRGWIFQRTDSSPDIMEWKGLYTWAVERLQLAQIQINKQSAALEEKGWTKPVILRYYDNKNKPPQGKPRKSIKTHEFALVNGKPIIPEIKQEQSSLQKLHYALIDGSSMVYYPSGQLAVCQSYSGMACGGFYSNIFSPDQIILGTFTPFGHGSIFLPNSETFALHYNEEGGMMANKEGEIAREWDWPVRGKLSEPIILPVNEYISIKIVGQFSVTLIYKWQHETVRLCLSPLLDVSPPHLEDLGMLLTNESFSSRTARELCKGNRKKGKEKDSKKSPKKTTILSELAKTFEIPENHISTLNDFKAATELHKLQRKIRNIVDDWMEHYRLALGIDLPHIKEMSEVPPRTLRKRKIQSAAVFPISSTFPKLQSIKQADTGYIDLDLHRRFLSAPADTHIRRWDTPRSSASLRPTSIQSSKRDQALADLSLSKSASALPTKISGLPAVTLGPLVSTDHDSEPLWLLASQTCPIILQNLMLGREGRICRCNNYQIPHVTDLEYDQLIDNMKHSDQITVVCVVSSLISEEHGSKDMMDQLYEKINRYRTMPCMQGRLDSFRLLKYDVDLINEGTTQKNSLLAQRHNAAAGMILMYIRGKLLFANYIFNGYGRSIKDLLKQITQTRNSHHLGYCLPNDFKFSHEGRVKCSSVNAALIR
uniref:FAM194 C-terminal domain-containing protein n=1 Tax=Leptobrachium leishanense TaxID=445787 RepID=A0A8C5Q1S9_9ANUR